MVTNAKTLWQLSAVTLACFSARLDCDTPLNWQQKTAGAAIAIATLPFHEDTYGVLWIVRIFGNCQASRFVVSESRVPNVVQDMKFIGQPQMPQWTSGKPRDMRNAANIFLRSTSQTNHQISNFDTLCLICDHKAPYRIYAMYEDTETCLTFNGTVSALGQTKIDTQQEAPNTPYIGEPDL